MKVGDVVKLTLEGKNYISSCLRRVTCQPVGLIVKKYIYEDGDEMSNGQYVYDVLVSGQIVQTLFHDEIALSK